MSVNDLRKGRFSQPGQEYLITCVTWRRHPWFHDFHLARLLIQTMRQSEEKGFLSWFAWVVMPDHFHALVRLEQQTLSRVIGRFKGYSAHALNHVLGRTGRFWQPGFHDHALRREEDRLEVARYLVANPLRAGLVRSVRDYPHWDCIWFE
jgi:REP element-mobilizing transposase RayT